MRCQCNKKSATKSTASGTTKMRSTTKKNYIAKRMSRTTSFFSFWKVKAAASEKHLILICRRRLFVFRKELRFSQVPNNVCQLVMIANACLFQSKAFQITIPMLSMNVHGPNVVLDMDGDDIDQAFPAFYVDKCGDKGVQDEVVVARVCP